MWLAGFHPDNATTTHHIYCAEESGTRITDHPESNFNTSVVFFINSGETG
jgi:hypothetical protein